LDRYQLWQTDGTSEGTEIVTEFPFRIEASVLVRIGEKIVAWLDVLGRYDLDLWVSDGTANGTSYLTSVGCFQDRTIVEFNGKIFWVDDCSESLSTTDGTQEGTFQLPLDAKVDGSMLTRVNNHLYFTASDDVNGYELWKSDGSAVGASMVKDIYTGTDSSGQDTRPNHSFPDEMVAFQDRLYFSASTGDSGRELWLSDGTDDGTVQVKDIWPGSTSSDPSHLTVAGGIIFFYARDDTHGYELWKSDGSADGTTMIVDINPGIESSNPEWLRPPLANVAGRVLFRADDGVHGTELWASDGTQEGTLMVKDIMSGTESSLSDKDTGYFTVVGDSAQPKQITQVCDRLIFSAESYNPQQENWLGRELWALQVDDYSSNSTPTATGDSYEVNEDTDLAVYTQGVLENDADSDGDPLQARILVVPSNGVVNLLSDGKFFYRPSPNYEGTDTFTYEVHDGRCGFATAQVTIMVHPVNDEPSFIASAPLFVPVNPGMQTVSGFATFDPGAENESSQSPTYFVKNVVNTLLFTLLPAVDPAGTLTYETVADTTGTSAFEVYVQDDGGTEREGVDTSPSQIFTITVTRLAQVIDFPPLSDKYYSEPPFELSATASSGLGVTFTSDTPEICTVAGNMATLVAAGDCTIHAAQSGNSAYYPAPDVTRSFVVAKLDQTISFESIADRMYGDPTFVLSATASSGLAVDFASAMADVCRVNGNIVTILGAGACTIIASQSGNSEYGAASPVSRNFTVAKSAQVIDFNAPADMTYGDAPFAFQATATSGLPVSFRVETPGICTVNGTQGTIVAAGSCRIVA
jgi:ELWxxDGT repeat protein